MTQAETFGQYLTIGLQDKGWSERHLARITGVANSTIVRIKNGSIPEPGLFIALVDALGLDVIAAVQLVEPYNRIYQRIISARKGVK